MNIDKKRFLKSNETDENDLIEIKSNDLSILAKNLAKNYIIGDFIIKAVDNVNLKVKSGEFLVIKGHSGMGKTTLLNLLSGIDSPDEGIIYVNNIQITSLKEESLTTFRLMNSGFIFQSYNLISTLTAEENIMFPMSLAGMTLQEQRIKAVKLLKKVGLSERREHLPFQLSSGEQQRVALARALANNPPIIFADEPTANLDRNTTLLIKDIFEDLKKEKKTIVMVTHDNDLMELADRIVVFDKGKISEEILCKKE